jgi:hypothetical protein
VVIAKWTNELDTEKMHRQLNGDVTAINTIPANDVAKTQ